MLSLKKLLSMKEDDRCPNCNLLVIELCKNCHQPKPSPWHDVRNACPDKPSTVWEPSGKFVCIECCMEGRIVKDILDIVTNTAFSICLPVDDTVVLVSTIKRRFGYPLSEEEKNAKVIQEAPSKESQTTEASSSTETFKA